MINLEHILSADLPVYLKPIHHLKHIPRNLDLDNHLKPHKIVKLVQTYQPHDDTWFDMLTFFKLFKGQSTKFTTTNNNTTQPRPEKYASIIGYHGISKLITYLNKKKIKVDFKFLETIPENPKKQNLKLIETQAKHKPVFSNFMRWITDTKRISYLEEKVLFYYLHNSSNPNLVKLAKQKIIDGNKKNIIYIMSHLFLKPNENDSLQENAVGTAIATFIEQVDVFDPEKYNIQFTTFAYYMTKQRTQIAINNELSDVVLPQSILTKIYHFNKFAKENELEKMDYHQTNQIIKAYRAKHKITDKTWYYMNQFNGSYGQAYSVDKIDKDNKTLEVKQNTIEHNESKLINEDILNILKNNLTFIEWYIIIHLFQLTPQTTELKERDVVKKLSIKFNMSKKQIFSIRKKALSKLQQKQHCFSAFIKN